MAVSRRLTTRAASLRSGLSCALLSIVCACYSPDPKTGAPCTSDLVCPSGQACIDGYCGGRPSGLVDAQQDAPPLPDAAVDAPPPECVVDDDCTPTSACRAAACVDGACVETTRPDGAACGTSAANRCCTGVCVDISSDEANCGGCGQACATGRTCESVAVTNTCELAPAATTGRCTCAGVNAECPDAQICRTATPYANRCTPNGGANCAAGQTFVEVNFCPNYCRYP